MANDVTGGTAPSTWCREEAGFALVDRTSDQFVDASLPGNVLNHQLRPIPAKEIGPFFAQSVRGGGARVRGSAYDSEIALVSVF